MSNAIQWTGDNTQEVIDWLVQDGLTAERREEPIVYKGYDDEDDWEVQGPFIIVRSPQGWTTVLHPGEYAVHENGGTTFYTEGAYKMFFEESEAHE